MPSPRLALLLPAAVAAAGLTGCAIGDDGKPTSQTRNVASFTRLDSPGSVDVRLHVGQPQRVVVHAGDKVIDDIHTDVGDGTLRLTFDHDGWGGVDVTADISVPKLTAIDASGSGDIDADGIDADAFELRSDGSADISLRGDVGRLAVDLDGSGKADLDGLATRQARLTLGGSGDVDGLTARAASVSVSGSGSVDVRAAERLDADVDGSGDIRYHGDPKLTEHVDGSGDVTRAG